ncbi:hypothetical protein HY497_00725 [Candidatus Woesearchaeota archaeon]|nr:hypothetical protein [Candidatus Woesearchaeota archaeon]
MRKEGRWNRGRRRTSQYHRRKSVTRTFSIRRPKRDKRALATKVKSSILVVKKGIIGKRKKIPEKRREKKVRRRFDALSVLFIALVAAAAALLVLFILYKWNISELNFVDWFIARSAEMLSPIKIWLRNPFGLQLFLASFISLAVAGAGLFLLNKIKAMPLKKRIAAIEKPIIKKKTPEHGRAIQVKLEPYETEIDAIYQYIQKKQTITLEEVAEKFKVAKELAEEWAKILESHKLITLNYSPFGAMILALPKPEKKEEAT